MIHRSWFGNAEIQPLRINKTISFLLSKKQLKTMSVSKKLHSGHFNESTGMLVLTLVFERSISTLWFHLISSFQKQLKTKTYLSNCFVISVKGFDMHFRSNQSIPMIYHLLKYMVHLVIQGSIFQFLILQTWRFSDTVVQNVTLRIYGYRYRLHNYFQKLLSILLLWDIILKRAKRNCEFKKISGKEVTLFTISRKDWGHDGIQVRGHGIQVQGYGIQMQSNILCNCAGQTIDLNCVWCDLGHVYCVVEQVVSKMLANIGWPWWTSFGIESKCPQDNQGWEIHNRLQHYSYLQITQHKGDLAALFDTTDSSITRIFRRGSWESLVASKSVRSNVRGGSRIPRRRGRQPSYRGVPTYDFAKFSQKPHENEKILGHGSGGAGSTPLDPSLNSLHKFPFLFPNNQWIKSELSNFRNISGSLVASKVEWSVAWRAKAKEEVEEMEGVLQHLPLVDTMKMFSQ